MTPIQKTILQTFVVTGWPMDPSDVAKALDDGKFGRGKLAIDFCRAVCNQCVREKWLSRDDSAWHRLTDEGRKALEAAAQDTPQQTIKTSNDE